MRPHYIRKSKPVKTLFLTFVVLAIISAAAWFLWSQWTDHHLEDETRYADLIESIGTEYGVDPLLIRAVIWQESRFNAGARGTHLDLGLMQIVPTASVTDWARMRKIHVPTPAALLDPELNIEIGTWYLGCQLRAFASTGTTLEAALSAYNAGPRKASEWFFGKKTPEDVKNPILRIEYGSTRKYVNAILLKYAAYRKAAGRVDAVQMNEGVSL